MQHVEFALQPQHETSSDSGLQLISDINDLENKSRENPEVCHYFQYIVVIGTDVGKQMFYKEMDFHPNI